MTEKPSRGVPDEQAATPDELEAAIKALTPGDLLKLRQYSDWRIGKLGRRAAGRTGHDLLLAAVTSTRRWNKSNVDFKGFLYGAIKSISSNWARPPKTSRTAILEADLIREDEDGSLFSPLDNAQDRSSSPEEQANATQTLDLIEGLFKDDEKALMVLTAAREGYSPADVRELWNLSQKEYNAIMTRIRRHSRAVILDGANVHRGS